MLIYAFGPTLLSSAAFVLCIYSPGKQHLIPHCSGGRGGELIGDGDKGGSKERESEGSETPVSLHWLYVMSKFYLAILDF